jgi:cytochrome c-type biogenesis protein
MEIVVGSFLAGIVSFLAPCSAISVPAITALLAGHSLEKKQMVSGLENKENTKIKKRSKLWLWLSVYILSFSMMLVSLGMVATGVGLFLSQWRQFLQIGGGLLLVFFGLFMCFGVYLARVVEVFFKKVFKKNVPVIEFVYQDRVIGVLKFDTESISKKVGNSWLFPLTLGSTTALAWTPCIGPILGVVLTLASNQESVLKGGLLLFFYSLGINIPLVIIAVFGKSIKGLFQKKWINDISFKFKSRLGISEVSIKKTIRKLKGVLYFSSGIMIVVIGFGFIFNWHNFLAMFISQNSPQLISNIYLQNS